MCLERMIRLEKHRIGRIGKDRTKKSKVTRGRGKGYRICTRCASRTVRHVHLVLYDMCILCCMTCTCCACLFRILNSAQTLCCQMEMMRRLMINMLMADTMRSRNIPIPIVIPSVLISSWGNSFRMEFT